MENIDCQTFLKSKFNPLLKIDENRRLGGESDREILMGPACVILSLGVWSSICPPGRGLPWGLVFDFVAK